MFGRRSLALLARGVTVLLVGSLVAGSLVAGSLVACSGNSEQPAPPPPPPQDAAPPDTITEIGMTDPSRNLDPDPTPRAPSHKKPKTRPSRPIDIVLKSSPPGAIAWVDGVEIGRTPTYWYGESDGLEHMFTFSLAGHAVGTYRFVPIQSGTVHARLQSISEDQPAAGAGTNQGPNQGSAAPTFTPEPPESMKPEPVKPEPVKPEPVKPPDTVITPGSGSAATAGSGAPAAGTGAAAAGSGAPAGSATQPSGSKIGPQP